MEREAEMEMRSKEEIEIGTDITPTLTPLSFSLHTSLLHTHCSTCFSPLPISSQPNSNSLFYCSPPCSAALSSLHLSSAERHLPPSAHSSEHCAALRLLHSHSHHPSPSGRVAGLLSNRHLLTCQKNPSYSDDGFSESIRFGASAMAEAIAKQRGVPCNDAVLEEATVALCAVLTNSVEVHDSEERSLGIAVYDLTFSWMNHSCSPNACYRFDLTSSYSPSDKPKLCIAPFTRHSQQPLMDGGICSSSYEFVKEGELGYGPRLIVRSIKRIKEGEEVTVAYTDILQPKAMRQLELWSKYQFICCCKRCSVLPFTYVDHALQEISFSNHDSCSNYKFPRDMADRRLTECIDDVMSEYLCLGDSESCCKKLEKILLQGLNEQLEGIERKSDSKFMLHPLHHLSLKVYYALASAYKVCASDLLSVDSEINVHLLEAFEMSRTSAAYSLLLARATHHLFNSDSSLIASAAYFWTGAGESLLSLTTSSGWSKFVNLGPAVSDLASVTKVKCSKCSLMDTFGACISNGHIKSTDFDNVSNEFLHCVRDIALNVWSFLVCKCHFLRSCINFSWLMSTKDPSAIDVEARVNKTDVCYTHESENNLCTCVEQTYTGHAVTCIFQLGVHCLAYGGVLASICYGPHSHLARHVQNILDRENSFVLYSHEES